MANSDKPHQESSPVHFDNLKYLPYPVFSTIKDIMTKRLRENFIMSRKITFMTVSDLVSGNWSDQISTKKGTEMKLQKYEFPEDLYKDGLSFYFWYPKANPNFDIDASEIKTRYRLYYDDSDNDSDYDPEDYIRISESEVDWKIYPYQPLKNLVKFVAQQLDFQYFSASWTGFETDQYKKYIEENGLYGGAGFPLIFYITKPFSSPSNLVFTDFHKVDDKVFSWNVVDKGPKNMKVVGKAVAQKFFKDLYIKSLWKK